MPSMQCKITLTGDVTQAEKICHIPDAALRDKYPDLDTVPVNSYTCPVGQASGRAWVLMNRADLDVLTTTTKAGTKDATFTLSMKAFFTNVDEFVSIPNLILVKAFRLNVGAPADEAALYLVELADKRLTLETWADSGVIQANIRSHANNADYLTGTAKTWDQLIEAVWNTMDHVLGTYSDSIASDGVPEGWDIRGENAWSVLHAILGKLGKTVAYSPIASTYSIVTLGASQPFPAAYDKHLLRDAEPIEHNATLAPETIRVYFRSHYKSYGQERDTELGTNWQVESTRASKSKDVATGISGAVTDSILQIWDDLPLVFDEDNSEDNDAALDTRAAAVAAAWLADAGISRSLKTYVGFKSDVLPGGTVKTLRWQNLNAGPMTVLTEKHGFSSGQERTDTGLAQILGREEELQTPDLSRGTYPNFPRLPNIVKVDDGASATGDVVAPNGDGLFPGFVQRWVAGSIATLESCWIRPVDLETGTSPSEATVISLRQDDKFLGRLSGIETSSASTRPIYLVRSSSSASENSSPDGSDGNFYGLANENWQQAGDSGAQTYSGTLTATNGDPTIDGLATFFLTELSPGATLLIDGAEYNILSIAAEDGVDALTLTSNFTGTTAGGYAVQKPALASTPSVPWIRVNPCDNIEGDNPVFATTHVVFWALFSAAADNEAEDPNVITQQTIGYKLGPDGEFFTEGYYNGKIGDAIFQTRAANNKQGWGRMDGNANSAANGGLGFIMTCFFPRGSTTGEGEEPLDGAQKGSKDHYHPVPIATTPATVQSGTGATLQDLAEDPTFCSQTNKSNDTCDCDAPECACEDSGNPCDLPIEYVHLHYMERLDNSEGYTAP